MKGVEWTYRGEEAGVGGAGGARSGGGDAVHGDGCDCGFCLVVKVEIGLMWDWFGLLALMELVVYCRYSNR